MVSQFTLRIVPRSESRSLGPFWHTAPMAAPSRDSHAASWISGELICTEAGCCRPIARSTVDGVTCAANAPGKRAATRGRRPHLLEAGAAVDRLVAAGLERYACLATAVAAGSREELTRATHATASAVCTAAATHATGGATRRTAGRATSRLVHETARGVELLLAGRPCEFLTAVFAGQSLVREAQFEASSLCCSRRLEPRQDLGRKCLT